MFALDDVIMHGVHVTWLSLLAHCVPNAFVSHTFILLINTYVEIVNAYILDMEIFR